MKGRWEVLGVCVWCAVGREGWVWGTTERVVSSRQEEEQKSFSHQSCTLEGMLVGISDIFLRVQSSFRKIPGLQFQGEKVFYVNVFGLNRWDT